ncbi:hypothetical protein DDP54_04810 [Cellulomonas sp. WB94]|nr:hypothetical protein DDP54_04810 [Cellulomonas sp. WB94]
MVRTGAFTSTAVVRATSSRPARSVTWPRVTIVGSAASSDHSTASTWPSTTASSWIRATPSSRHGAAGWSGVTQPARSRSVARSASGPSVARAATSGARLEPGPNCSIPTPRSPSAGCPAGGSVNVPLSRRGWPDCDDRRSVPSGETQVRTALGTTAAPLSSPPCTETKVHRSERTYCTSPERVASTRSAATVASPVSTGAAAAPTAVAMSPSATRS